MKNNLKKFFKSKIFNGLLCDLSNIIKQTSEEFKYNYGRAYS